MPLTPLRLVHNGTERATFVEAGENLLDTLRRRLGDLTPKFGCGQGTCGACTVLIDGRPRLACLTLAESVEGASVESVGALADGARLSPLQEAFAENFAAQCGYCTCGMLMAATALLRDNPRPSRAEVIDAIAGNLCRCTGYEPIVAAVLAAAGATPAARAR